MNIRVATEELSSRDDGGDDVHTHSSPTTESGCFSVSTVTYTLCSFPLLAFPLNHPNTPPDAGVLAVVFPLLLLVFRCSPRSRFLIRASRQRGDGAPGGNGIKE